MTILSFCQNDSITGDHFGKRTEWSLICTLIYAYLNILAQSQLLVISLLNMRFGLILGQLAILEKKVGGPNMSNLWGQIFMFSGAKTNLNFFWKYLSVCTKFFFFLFFSDFLKKIFDFFQGSNCVWLCIALLETTPCATSI